MKQFKVKYPKGSIIVEQREDGSFIDPWNGKAITVADLMRDGISIEELK